MVKKKNKKLSREDRLCKGVARNLRRRIEEQLKPGRFGFGEWLRRGISNR